MDRRQLLSAAAAGALLPAAGSAAAPFPKPRRRPNVLFVFSDQHRAVSMPGEPFSPVVAPALDAFRKANFSMDRCVSNYPLCTPYRAIMMSGRWPYQNGATQNGAPLKHDTISMGRVFKDAGYHTAYVGKWHLQGGGTAFVPPGPGRLGFEDFHVWQKTQEHFASYTYDQVTGAKQESTGWNCTAMTDQAISILKQQKPDKPWMMVLSWNPPHPPFEAPAEDETVYAATQPKRPNVKLIADGKKQLRSEAALHEAMKGYYGAITGVDGEFARVLKALEETGQADDTIVVYTSDHGEMMGSHSRMAKMVPFEESCLVPFYVRYPGVTKAKAASNTLFQAIDIYPTLCGLAGLPVPRHCSGRDLSAIMRGQAVANPPKAAFLMNQFDVGHSGDDDAESDAGEGRGGKRKKPSGMAQRLARAAVATSGYDAPNYRGIRTDTHTYAVAENGRWCLFDNVADPYQQNNLIRDPAQAGLIASLDKQIEAWLKSAEDPFPFAKAITSLSPLPA